MSTPTPQIVLIGEPRLRQLAQPADTTDVSGLWAAMLELVNAFTVNQTVFDLGSAISAPQVMQANSVAPARRLFVVNLGGGAMKLYVNPVLTPSDVSDGGGPLTWNSNYEGCLSIPNVNPNSNINYYTPRYQHFTITYYTFFQNSAIYTPVSSVDSPLPTTLPSSVKLQQTVETFQYVPQATPTTPQTLAAYQTANQNNWVVQHEIDHLNGKLYTDYILLKPPYSGTSNQGVAFVAGELLSRAENHCNNNLLSYAYNTSITVSSPSALPPEQQALIYGSNT